nr:hypothetical protein XACLD7_7740002 [Xanthomonas citri pv. citri]
MTRQEAARVARMLACHHCFKRVARALHLTAMQRIASARFCWAMPDVADGFDEPLRRDRTQGGFFGRPCRAQASGWNDDGASLRI